MDYLVPLEKTINKLEKITPPQAIKSKINRRNNLIKKLKCNNINPNNTRNELKSLNKDIKKHAELEMAFSKSLWDAVRLAKDINANSLAETLYENNI